MKMRKSLTHNLLITELYNQVPILTNLGRNKFGRFFSADPLATFPPKFISPLWTRLDAGSSPFARVVSISNQPFFRRKKFSKSVLVAKNPVNPFWWQKNPVNLF
jgi:hypothetical protein